MLIWRAQRRRWIKEQGLLDPARLVFVDETGPKNKRLKRLIIMDQDGYNPKMETVTVKAQSEAYFRILALRPEVKDVYALGNYVVWVTPSGKALIIDRGAGVEKMDDTDINRLFVAPPKAEPKKIEKK